MNNNKNPIQIIIQNDLGKYYSFFKMQCKYIELWLRGSEALPIWKTIYALRHYEYYINKGNNISKCGVIKRHYWRFKFRQYQLKYNIHIEPNTTEMGLHIVHPGFRKIPKFVHIGKNCTILPMALLGKKTPGIEGEIIIGDNCYISTGVTILGPISIGNNVIIGAGAVVTHDIPDNTIVAGVPAKIIKKK